MSDSAELPRIRRFWVDTQTCIDQRRCVIEAPELVGDSKVKGGPVIITDRPRNDTDMLALLNAAWVCPTASFKIELEDGTVRDSSDRYVRELGKAWSKLIE
jgi:ferredoxin